MSSHAFLMVLCSDFSSALLGVSSETKNLLSESCIKRQSLRKKLCTPLIPLVSHGLNCSNGPKNISYILRVSAPNFSIKSSGVCTLYLDLDIFSISCPQVYCPLSFKINSASANSLLHFLKTLRLAHHY